MLEWFIQHDFWYKMKQYFQNIIFQFKTPNSLICLNVKIFTEDPAFHLNILSKKKRKKKKNKIHFICFHLEKKLFWLNRIFSILHLALHSLNLILKTLFVWSMWLIKKMLILFQGKNKNIEINKIYFFYHPAIYDR